MLAPVEKDKYRERQWSALSPEELNDIYARLDARLNGLRSNWDWFTRVSAQRQEEQSAPFARVEQN